MIIAAWVALSPLLIVLAVAAFAVYVLYTLYTIAFGKVRIMPKKRLQPIVAQYAVYSDNSAQAMYAGYLKSYDKSLEQYENYMSAITPVACNFCGQPNPPHSVCDHCGGNNQ